jgi:cell wall-associated NlpC family hydrolase
MYKAKVMRSILNILISGILVAMTGRGYADTTNSSLFPIENYAQHITSWLNPNLSTYNRDLLSSAYQMARLQQLQHIYFGTSVEDSSPWSKAYLDFIFNPSLQQGKSILAGEEHYINEFDNQRRHGDRLGYGMNYRPYPSRWIEQIWHNMNLQQFESLSYQINNRAITTENLLARLLPTNDPFFLSSKLPGEGYPFDQLQATHVYAGTPLYIIGASQDKSWLLVLSPDYIAWVRSQGVARVDSKFIQQWQQAAYSGLAGITQTNTSIIDKQANYRFTGYVGMLLPVMASTANRVKVLMPVKQANGMASIAYATLAKENAAILPLAATPANFVRLITSLQGRPYGWGSTNFYTDCSAEMKAIFSLLGIYLPRNAANQVLAGKLISLNAKSAAERLSYLQRQGIPLLTLIHLKGHVLMYIGNYIMADGKPFAQSYQQIWGLAPPDRSRRAIIGQSVFLPLLLQYPEDIRLASLASGSVFELIYLDQWPQQPLRQGLTELLYK